MKAWLLCLAGMVCFIIAAVLGQSNLGKTTRHFGRELTVVEKALQARDWPKTQRSLEKLANGWERAKFIWALLLNHKEIDAIEQSLTRSKKAVDGRSYTDAAIELGSLRYFLKHVPQRERLDWVNIF
jgi:hypothetical protein